MPITETNVSTNRPGKIGAVVIGRNEGERLRHCLTAARRLADPVVYVDSASTDDSIAVAASAGAITVSLGTEQPLTAARGRRAGYEKLLQIAPDSEFVQFVDGDCILDPEWVERAAEFLRGHSEAAVACGRRREAHPDASFYNRLIDAEWDTPVGQAQACGGDALMRIAALREVGSFRADLVAGEEPELCTRLRGAGWQIWRLPEEMTEHDAKIMHFGEWWRRARRGGFGYAQVWSATRTTASPLYFRQMVSAVGWSVGLPLVAVGAALLLQDPWLLLLAPMPLAVQVLRIASRPAAERSFGQRLRAAATMMLVKFAETRGILQYFVSGHGQSASYRGSPTPAAEAGR